MKKFLIFACLSLLFAGCGKKVVDDYVEVYRQATEAMETVSSADDFACVSRKNEEAFRRFEGEHAKELDALCETPEEVVRLMEAQQLYGQTAAAKAQTFAR